MGRRTRAQRIEALGAPVRAASARLAGGRGRHAPPKTAESLEDVYLRDRAELTPAQRRRAAKRRRREGS